MRSYSNFQPTSSFDSMKFMMLIFFGFMAIIVVSSIGVGAYNQSAESSIEATVDTTIVQQLISKEGTDMRYLVLTDKGTFICESNILKGKFDNSDVFFRLKRNRKYHFTLSGIGKTFATDYKNIIDAKEIK